MQKLNLKSGLLFAALGVAVFVLSVGNETASAAFPGANGKIVFSGDRDGSLYVGGFEIYTMNPDGSDLRQLTNNNSGYNAQPSWSSDGTKIAWSTLENGNIYTMNADGSNQIRITNNNLGYYNDPAWSPDGTKIAFTGYSAVDSEIYVVNADGSNQIRITNNSGFSYLPAWSPDGTKIAYSSTRDGNYEIYTMNADGSSQARITNSADYDDTQPAWSPDGTKIAFASMRHGDERTDTMDEGIYIMNADGSHLTRITNNGWVDYEPDWSPDGTKIAFESTRDGNYEIYVMNVDGSDQTRITNDPLYSNLHPNWQAILTEAPENTPPRLSFPETGPYAGDGIDPNSGDTTTRFTFRVIYTDPDDNKPSFIEWCLDKSTDTGWQDEICVRIGAFSDEPDYSAGMEMLNDLSMSGDPGQYRYYFETSDGTHTVRFPETDGFPLVIKEPRSNTPPTLSFPETGPYAGDGIDPNSGDTTTEFTFRVIYTDADNDPPSFINAFLFAYATATVPMSVDTTAEPALHDGNYANGEQYVAVGKREVVGTHYYDFEASDGENNAVQLFSFPTNVTGFPLEISDIDTDGDGLLDEREKSIGTNPQNADTDTDGIKDGHEVNGVDVNGDGSAELFFSQANPKRKDIFVEVDCMVDRCNNSNIFFETFTEGVFDTVKEVFANAPVSNYDGTQGISIHFLVDEIDVPLEDSIGEEWFNTDGKEFFGTKDERQDADKDKILRSKTEDFLFHYVFFVNKYEGGGGAGEEPGNDLVIANKKVPILGHLDSHDEQSSKLLHELGHNLGLGHGGRVRLEGEEMTPDGTNCKPNYLSAMNYARTYDIKYGFLEFRTLPRVFDFSSEALPPLEENALNEIAGIGTDQLSIFGPPPSIIANGLSIDWNRDGDTTDENVSEVVIGGRTMPADINWISDKMSKCGSNTATRLEGSNDWGNLLFDARGYPGFTRGFFDASQNNGLIVEQDAQEVIEEMKIIGRTIVGDVISIDIKPGSRENPINCRNQFGVIPVAVLASQEFNSTNINPSSVLFGYLGREAQATEKVLHLEDVDADGDLDAVFHFRAQDTGIECGDTKALLTGEYTNGIPFWGEDDLVTVGGKK